MMEVNIMGVFWGLMGLLALSMAADGALSCFGLLEVIVVEDAYK